MSIFDDIERDRNRPQIKIMSMSTWTVKTDDPMPGWVKVVGPCIPAQCPTLATDLNGEDYIARHAEARRIARVPDLERIALAANELAEQADNWLNGGKTWDHSLSEALTKFREATQ
jgi:hypothetical protein